MGVVGYARLSIPGAGNWAGGIGGAVDKLCRGAHLPGPAATSGCIVEGPVEGVHLVATPYSSIAIDFKNGSNRN